MELTAAAQGLNEFFFGYDSALLGALHSAAEAKFVFNPFFLIYVAIRISAYIVAKNNFVIQERFYSLGIFVINIREFGFIDRFAVRIDFERNELPEFVDDLIAVFIAKHRYR